MVSLEQQKRLSKIDRDRFFLLDCFSYKLFERDLFGDGCNDSSIFKVSGSTGNVYTINFQNKGFFCDCPDASSHAKRHNVDCKHVCFVIYRVLRQSFPYDYWETRRLDIATFQEWMRIAKGIERKFSSTDSGSQTDCERVYRQVYRERKNKLPGEESTGVYEAKTVHGLDIDCPICFEPLSTSENDSSLLCSCGDKRHSVHQTCMDMWLRANPTRLNCFTCRRPIVYRQQTKPSQYINVFK